MSSSVRWPTSGGNWQSQQLTHNENRTMKGKSSGKSHSWWWDSHNAPKNSKWLEDNLNDMDAKVKAMLKLIEEDADSFAKRAEMYYKKRPELISLVEEFYRAYRSLAERYDQLTGHIRQIPQEIQAQFGFSGDAPPGSPGSAGSVRRKAAGFSMFASPGTPKRSKEKGRKDGSDSSSSSSSDSDSDSKRKPKQSDEILRIQEENEQLRKDLDKGVAHHQALESRLAELQEELKSLQHQNVQLHRNAASAHSEIATLEADIERLKRENHALGEEASTAIRTAEKLQKELELAQDEQQRLFTRLEENGLLMQRLEEKIKELEARIVQLTEELLSRTASCQHLEQELVAVTEEKRSLLDDVSSKASQIVELEEEIARLQASLSLSVSERERHFELHQTLEKTLADVHVQFSSAREEKGKLSEELLFKVQHVQLLEQQLKQVQVALEGSEREKAGMVELLSKAESRLLDLQNEFGSMQEKLNGEIFMQTEEKDAYKKQVEELQAALAALHRENSRGVELQDILAKRLTDLELQLKDAKGALKSSEREKAEVTGLLSTVKTSLTELEGEFGSMEVKFNVEAQKKRALKAQVVELQAALEALQGEKNLGLELQGLLEKQLRDVEQQLKQVQEALEASDQEKSEGNRLLKELEVEFGSMQVKLNAEVKEKQALDALVEELQAALMALQGEKSQGLEFQGLLEKQLMYVKQQLKQVQEALEASDREKSEVNKLLDELENNFLKLQHEFGSMQEKLTGEISVLSEEKQVLKGQVVDLQAALAALHGERSRGMELHDVLEKRLMDLEQKLVQVQSALELAEKEKAEMGGLLSKANIHLTELQAEVISVQSRLREEISTLTQEKQVLIKQVEELQATLAAFHDEKSRGIELQDVFEKQLKELQLELSQAKHEASCLSDELAEKGGAISQLEGEVNSRDDIISSLQRDLVAKQKEGESLQNHLEECSNELQAFESEVQRLQSLLIESEDLARNLEAQIVEIQQNFELERMEVKKLRDDLEDKVVVVGRFEAEVQNRDILIASLHDDISTKLEEIQVLREEIKSMTTEKMTLSEESLVNLKKITKLQKELEETLETLAERTTFILNLEIEYKRLTEDLSQSQQKSVQHVSQWQLVTSDKERLELELLLLQEANSKLQIEVASKSSQVDRLMLDLKTSEKTVILTMEENAKLTADLDSEVTRSHITDEKCRLQEQVIYDLQEDKTKLLGLAEELKLSICKLQEEIIDLKVKSEDARQEKKNLELEIQGLRDELSKINGMNQEQSTQLLETISYLKVEINRLEVCLSSGTEQLQFFEKEQEKWNKDKAVMDESIDQLTKEKQELQDTILLWSKQMEKLQTEHTTLKTSSRDVESSLLFHQTEHSRMKSDLFEKSERIHWLEEELKRLQLDLSSSQEETRQLSIELQQVTEDLKDQLRAEQGKVRLLHDDIDRLQQGLLSVQEARTTDSLACQEHVKVFQIKEESLESQIIKLKGEIHDLDELCKELAGNLADKTKEQEVLQAEMEKLHQDLRKTRQQWRSAEAKCDSLASELAQEHESRATAQAACVKFQAEIAELVETIASLQAELQQLKEAKELLTVKVEAAVEQEKIDAMEIEMLLRALQGEHEGNGSHNIGEHSWHFEVKNSTFRHLKESMVNLLTDRSRIQEEAAAHAEHVKVLNLEIAKSGQMLDSTRGDYHTLFIKHESVLAELQALQLRLSQFQGQVQYLEEEKTKLHDQLLASGRDSDELSTQLLREKKELYEKLVVEGELVLRLQQELKMAREEIVESKRNIDGLHKQIEKLLIDIQEVSKAKEVQEKDFSQEVQQHVEEKASTLQSLTEALRALSVEKAEVQKHQDEILLKNQQLLRLEEELALLRATLLGKEQEFLGLQQHKNSLESRLEAEIRKLEESWTSWQEEKTSLESSLSLNQQKGMELQEQLGNLTQEKDKISLELQARVVALDMQQLEVHRLQKLLEESKLVIISLRDEKISVSEQHALSLGRCNDLEALCKSLQKQRAEHQAEKRQYEAQLSVIEELRKEALDDEEMMKLMHERVANKQQEIDQVQSINEDLKEIMRKFESEMESLKDQIIILQKKNTLLNEEMSTKASLVRELDQSFKSLKEKKVVFEGGFALAVGDVGLVQAEVDKLLEKISKLSELSVASGENLRKMEERICKLQVSNLNLRDEFSVLAKKEKSYVIAVRFMRAEFFCLVQRIKAMKQEKAEAAMQVELAVEAERKKNGEVLSGLQQELAFLREENKRQRTIIFDRAEEKREAIRQLCITLDFMQTKNRRLEGVINSVREKIQRRIAASNARR